MFEESIKLLSDLVTVNDEVKMISILSKGEIIVHFEAPSYFQKKFKSVKEMFKYFDENLNTDV